jgi:single-strand DNA-binding protein
MSNFTLNTVTLGGNLTKDPELRSTPSGTSLCKLRLAVNKRRKDAGGNWVDKPNYFDVTIWGALGENVAQNLRKGSKLAVTGELEWREWDATDGSGKRQAVGVIAHSVFYEGQRNGNGGGQPAQTQMPQDDIPFAPTPTGAGPSPDNPPFT